jgi:TrkA domain protein
MGVRVERTDLAGIGFRDDVITQDGARIGVLTYREGGREVAIFAEDDPDAIAARVTVTAAEADALSELLGQAKTLDFLNGVGGGVAGVYTEHLTLAADSRYIDHELGLTKARTKTGVSIVAIVRGTDVVPSPEPSEVLLSDDILVAVGTRKGLDALAVILSDSRA